MYFFLARCYIAQAVVQLTNKQRIHLRVSPVENGDCFKVVFASVGLCPRFIANSMSQSSFYRIICSFLTKLETRKKCPNFNTTLPGFMPKEDSPCNQNTRLLRIKLKFAMSNGH